MRLRLNLSDVDMQLQIRGWKTPNSEKDWADDWVETSLYLHSSYLHYDCDGDILLNCEVSNLLDALDHLLSGSMKEDRRLSFIEPDIEFGFHVAKRLYSTPGGIIYRDGYRDVDISLDMYINFWCTDGLGSNQFRMRLNRQEIEAFCVYLKTVTGVLSDNDSAVTELLRKGLLLPE